jgi:Flp pilus assembly protein CpaB
MGAGLRRPTRGQGGRPTLGVSRRVRAIAFGSAALACAALAAALAGGYRADLDAQLGPLRPVVVARATVPARRPLRPADVDRLLEVRRVPQRFAPGGALSAPEQAIGREPAGPIPAGAYLLAAQLRAPSGHRRRPERPLGRGRAAVEISVSAAAALATAARDPAGSRVDVVVTTEPGPGGGSGRTYVAVKDVELLALSQGAEDPSVELPGPGGASATATLALTRSQALRLIQAENFARQVRLIPR